MAPVAAVGRAELQGHKRRADDELEGEQPLTKKFGRLRIGRFSNPVQPLATPTKHDAQPPPNARDTSHLDSDGMQVDETNTRVYISDLEREIAEIEAEENRHALQFLPEVEKELMAIPKLVLNHRPDNELVLYRLPQALSIPEEEDKVRAVMADARERAREKSLASANANGVGPEGEITSLGTPTPQFDMNPIDETGGMPCDIEIDPMDIDD